MIAPSNGVCIMVATRTVAFRKGWRRWSDTNCIRILRTDVTIIGLQFGGMLASAVVVKNIFPRPAACKRLVDTIHVVDRPVAATLAFISVVSSR